MVHDQALRAQRISDLSDDMVTVMSAFVNTEILKRDLDSKGDPKLQNFLSELRELQQSALRREALIAFIGDMSGGKSSIANMLIGYPMFSVARVATSEMPAEVRYGKTPKLQVFTYSKSEDSEFQEKNVYTFDRLDRLPKKDKQRLVAYAKLLIDKRLLKCENLDYYYNFKQESEDEIVAGANDMIRIMQLMLIPLTASVGRGNPCYEDDPRHSEAIEMQKALLRDIFGMSDDVPFVTRVWLDSDLLKNGLVLVDLPGLGSGNALHTKITETYMSRADAFILPFDLEAKTAEVQKALGTILEYESMLTGGKDSRFISVLNKCDDPYERKGEDEYVDYIEQAVANIRPGLRGIQVSELIPISAHYGEYRLLENGVSPSRTMLGRRMKGASDDEIKQKLLANYQVGFEYYDQHTDRDVAYSTEDFMDRIVGEYAPRIRFLNVLRRLYDITAQYDAYKDDVYAQMEMLRLLELSGDSLMRNLLDKMARALKECQETIHNRQNETLTNINKNHLKLVKDLEIAQKSFVSGLERADNALKEHLKSEVKKMVTDAFNHVIIDENAYTETKKKNKEIFDGLVDYYKKFDFTPYLAEGNRLLKANLDAGRQLYERGIASIRNDLDTLAIKCNDALAEVYTTFLKELQKDDENQALTDDVKVEYDKCSQAASKAILGYLKKLGEQMDREMKNDQRITREIAVTTSAMAAAINKVENYYHVDCVNYMESKRFKTFALSRDSVDIGTIQKEYDVQFRNNEKNGTALADLKSVLIEDRANQSHKQRMEQTLYSVFNDFQHKMDNRIMRYIPHITEDVTEYFDDAGGRTERKCVQIGAVCGEMSVALTGLYKSKTIQDSVIGGKGMEFSRADAELAEHKLTGTIQRLEDAAEAARSMNHGKE